MLTEALAVADEAPATAATAEEAPATLVDAVPAADIAMDCTTAVLQMSNGRVRNGKKLNKNINQRRGTTIHLLCGYCGSTR